MKLNLNVALVGCGRVAETHLKALAAIPNLDLYALCDTAPCNLTALSEQYPAQLYYSSYSELLSDNNVDLIILCTPSGFHAEMAIEAAQKHKNVILEKPMAMNCREAHKIIDAFTQNQVSISIVLQNRYNAPVVFLKNMEGKLGRLNYISANVFWYRTQDYYEDCWHGSKSMDGGVLLNQGSHYADMLLYLANKKVKTVSAYAATLGHKMEADDTVVANLLFEDGTLGNIQANTISYPRDFEGSITLFYEKATIKIGGKAMNKIVYWQGVGETESKQIQEENIDTIYGNGHIKALQNMADHLIKGTTLDISGKEGLKSLELIENIQHSIDTGKTVYLR